MNRSIGACVFLVISTLAVYDSVRGHAFVSYDDPGDVLSTLFWLLCIMCYGEYARCRRPSWYGLTLLCLVLGTWERCSGPRTSACSIRTTSGCGGPGR